MNRTRKLASRFSVAMNVLPLLVCLGGTMGCELIASVDRSKIKSEVIGSGGAGGGGPQCSTATDCPGMDTFCQTRTCSAGVCGVENAPSGTQSDMQTPGDCLRQVCDGTGQLVAEADDTDVVDDQNQCTMDVCNAGQTEHVPVAAGSLCTSGSGKVCDAMAACVECIAGANCVSGVCTQNVCIASTCMDGVKNQNESDIDCGNSNGCPLCDIDKTCGANNDCSSDVCVLSKCVLESCGDGKVTGSEACDDGNTMSGDCCSAGCGLESGCEIEPNDTDVTANDWAMVSINGVVKAFNDPTSDSDVFSIVVPSGKIGTLEATVQDGPLGSSCTDPKDIDSFLVVRDAMGMLLGSNNDIDFITNRCSQLTLNYLPAGTYFVEQHRSTAAPMGKITYGYKLAIDLTLVDVGICGNGIRDPGEQCDDGNTAPLDGCAAPCTVEEDYHCTAGMPDVCLLYESKCDDGMDNDGDGMIDAADSDCDLPAYFPGCGMGEALRVYPSFGMPISIPDHDGDITNGQASSLIRVAGTGNTIARAALLMNISHSYVGDLRLNLKSPGAAEPLITNEHSGGGGGGGGGGGNGYVQTIVDPSCVGIIANGFEPYSACFEPDESTFMALVGTSSLGNWTLDAQDTSPEAAGTIDSWKLILCVMP